MAEDLPGGDSGHRELIEKYIHLVQAVTGRIEPLLPAEVDRGGLIGAGIMALLETIWHTPTGDSPMTNNFFQHQAKNNIWRATVAWMASQPWLVKRLRSSAEHLASVYEQIYRRHHAISDIGKEALEEMAVELEYTDEELNMWLREMDAYFTAWPSDFLGIETSDAAHEAVVEALSKLDPHARTIVALMHFEELTPAEVAAAIGTTENEVLRTHARAGLQMRALLGEAAIDRQRLRKQAS